MERHITANFAHLYGLKEEEDDQLLFPKGELTQQVHKDFEKFSGGKKFSSIDDLNKAYQEFTEIRNNTGLDEFLGLSPEQMFTLQRCKIFAKGSGLELNCKIDLQLIKNTPIVKLSEFILKHINDAGRIKATAVKKNLPRKFAQQFRDFYFAERNTEQDDLRRTIFKIQSEDDTPILFLLRMTLTECGWIKFQKNHFSLTKKGAKLAENGFCIKEFSEILCRYMSTVNWGYTDRYPETFIIQQHAYFLLYILYKKTDNYFSADEVGKAMLKAFPMIEDSCVGNQYFERDIEDTICRICENRFIVHFCYLFALLKTEQRPNKNKIFNRETFCRKTELFKNLFAWQN
jgi:hypothetical protein